MPEEYTGQLMGGPDDGNLVTATVKRFWHETRFSSELDGPNNPPSVITVCGWYTWDPDNGIFTWKRTSP